MKKFSFDATVPDEQSYQPIMGWFAPHVGNVDLIKLADWFTYISFTLREWYGKFDYMKVAARSRHRFYSNAIEFKIEYGELCFHKIFQEIVK